jgi:hypothetical protein
LPKRNFTYEITPELPMIPGKKIFEAGLGGDLEICPSVEWEEI